jgi:mono/diheme cytochrome c family protein
MINPTSLRPRNWLMPLRLMVGFTAFLLVGGGASAETAVDRGRYLVTTIIACGNCHTPKDANGQPILSRALSGGLSFDTPNFSGTASNITPDLETGIGRWSDADIKLALTTGVRPGDARLPGVPLSDVVPSHFYKVLLPRDADAIVAYLRTVSRVRNEVPPPNYKRQATAAPYPDAEIGFTPSSLNDQVRRGAYLATLGHCMGCHTPRTKGLSDFRNSLGKGGNRYEPAYVKGYPSAWQGSVASNITSHPQAGIGAWTDADIKRALTQGSARDGRELNTPMKDHIPYFRGMTDEDLNSLVAWLRTVPPLE